MRIYITNRNTNSPGRVAGWVPDYVARQIDSENISNDDVESTYRFSAAINDCHFFDGSISDLKIRFYEDIRKNNTRHDVLGAELLRKANNALTWLNHFYEETDPLDEMVRLSTIRLNCSDYSAFCVYDPPGEMRGFASTYENAIAMAKHIRDRAQRSKMRREGTTGERVKIVCRTCGSEDVLLDSWAQWNPHTQKAELVTTFDSGHYCQNCDGECTTKEVPLEE